MNTDIVVYVGSKNPVKGAAAREALLAIYPGKSVSVVAIDADPGIRNWRSMRAAGQPFGLPQTSFGALNRMKACAKEALNCQLSGPLVYAVGFENGLVEGEEIGKAPGSWHDIGIVALCQVREVKNVRAVKQVVIKQGGSVLTELGRNPLLSFDDQVTEYHKLIMPRVLSKVDLFLEWTKDNAKGPFTRQGFLAETFLLAHQQLLRLREATELVEGCSRGGVVASLGPRYRNMIWMRDMAYMAKSYLNLGQQEALREALRTHVKKQCLSHELASNGYEKYDPFGQMAIVAISEKGEKEFLLQRLIGSEKDPYWQRQLLQFCKEHNLLEGFPKLPEQQTVESLQSYYRELERFSQDLRKKCQKEPPAPSYALRCYMEGKLATLTPGTRDSEIHFIRLLTQAGMQGEFREPLENALKFLYKNVIDPQDGLPRGCDSRDIFADMLYDAKLLTNALFWYEALLGLGLTDELERLKKTIQEKFLFKEGKFCPRDFLPGARASLSFSKPIIPSPSNGLIQQYCPDFIRGELVDPQSLAYAVLLGLVPKEEYDKVLQLFSSSDSAIGVAVFVPISGKTQEESELLKRVRGRVVWPHVSWTVARACLKMGTKGALLFAEQQREKLSKLGFGEWYAEERGKAIQGGDPEQGWSASAMLLFEEALTLLEKSD